MSPSEKLDRRIDSSSDLSQYVYDFEKQYTEYMKKGYSEKNASIQARRTLNEILQENNPGLRSSDAMYDKETGIAAIAVKDKNTGETYIAYAGTNKDADGATDFISDANIGANNSAYLKRLGDKTTSFYDRVQSNGDNITVTTGHSYGDFLASRVAIELIPFFINFRKVNDSFHFCY
ncbi:TPA: hypothetical protein ACIOJB_000139 [Streptococcus agalactiae]